MKSNNPPEIIAITPLDPKINAYISYYYFAKKEDKDGLLEFWHYPHFKSALVLFNNSEIRIKDNIRYIHKHSKNKVAFVFNYNTVNAQKEIVKGSYDITGIVFNPLGVNHFNIHTLLKKDPLYQFDNYDNPFERNLKSVFKTIALSDRVKLLDKLFGDIYQAFNMPILERAIDMTIDQKGNLTLNELSTILKVSRRTLLRYFKLHLGFSFQAFKAVVKFRAALEQGSQEKGSMSKLAYDSNFYDQSDLIKGFKSKSNETPKKLFKDLTILRNKLIWKLE